jgi:hypothetical protein
MPFIFSYILGFPHTVKRCGPDGMNVDQYMKTADKPILDQRKTAGGD